MNRKFIIALAALVLAPAAFPQEFGALKDTLAAAGRQDTIIADTLAAQKAAADAARRSKWLEAAADPRSAQAIPFGAIPAPEKDAVGAYYLEFAAGLKTCDGEALLNTVKKANAEYPYFLRINFGIFDFNLGLGHSAGPVLSQMLDWHEGCRLKSKYIIEVYSLNKNFHDSPAQFEVLSKSVKSDAFKAAAKFFAERPVCDKSCKKELLKEALRGVQDNVEIIKMLIAKIGAPTADFAAVLINKPSLGDKDLHALRALLMANPGIIDIRIGGSGNLAAFLAKRRREYEEAYRETGLFWKMFCGYKKSIAVVDAMSKLVREMKAARTAGQGSQDNRRPRPPAPPDYAD